jgi:anaerobic selenocysteine-containing dehydrogenase
MENQRLRGERGWWLPNQPDFDSFWAELVERGGWADMFYDHTDPDRFARTPSGRIDLMPAAVLHALESEREGAQLYAQSIGEERGSDNTFPLRLLPYRVSTLASDTIGLERWLAEQPTVFPDVQWVPWVSVAPATAQLYGLNEDGMVWVVSPRGRYRARLRLSSGTAARTVCAPLGLRHPDGEPANPLQLLDGSGDPLAGMPAWFTTFVRLEPV